MTSPSWKAAIRIAKTGCYWPATTAGKILVQPGRHSPTIVYVADFVYNIAATGETIVEDAKGSRNREYKKKKKLTEKGHAFIINEV